jgi:hypothetical protein
MRRVEFADIPPEILGPLRARAPTLPEVREDPRWPVQRWLIGRRIFASVITTVNEHGDNTFLQFRSSGEELNVLLSTGPPFFRAGWGENVVGMVLTPATDWEEVGELLADSYCLMAPKKLVALVQPPLG